MEISEKQFFKGYWKLPEDDDYRVSGDLTFDPVNGGVLEVMGSFGGQNERTLEESHQIINGFTTDGQRLTLLNCTGFGNIVSPGIPILKLDVEIILIGKDHLKSPSDLLFEGAIFHFRGFDEWVGIDGFNREISESELSTISYRQPDPIKVFHSEKEDIFIWFSYSGPSLRFFSKERSIRQKTLFEFNFTEDKDFDYVLKRIISLKNFISFALSIPTFITKITLFKKTLSEKKKYFDVLIATNEFNQNQYSVSPHNMLFSFSDIKNKHQKIFSSWFNLNEELNPVFELYFQSIHNVYLGQENYFLNLMFALETYHRRTCKDEKFSLDEYILISSSLKKAVKVLNNKRYEEWLNSLLIYGNEISFRKRLRNILDGTHAKLLEKIPDKEKFISKILDTRNFLVHYDSSLVSKIIKTDEFFPYNLKLKVLLQLCLLQKLGFEDSQIGEFIVRTPTFWNVE